MKILRLTSFLILIVMFVTVEIKAETGTISEPAGFHRFTFRNGWNFISLPFLPVDPTLQNTFGGQLTSGESAEESDQIFSYNHRTGEWLDAWLNSNGDWEGSLADVELNPVNTFWVHINSASSDSQEVVIKGLAVDTVSVDMGLIPQGVHFISTLWATDLNLEFTNLSNSGWQPGDGVLKAEPADEEELLSDLILGYNRAAGWSRLAWFDGTNWHGNLSSLNAGGAYMLIVNDQLNWSNYPRPGGNTLNLTTSSKSWIPVNFEKTAESQEIPDIPIFKHKKASSQNNKLKSDRRIKR